jgi:hypothetical protein
MNRAAKRRILLTSPPWGRGAAYTNTPITYDDRDGNARKVTEVVVTQLRLLGGSGATNGNVEPRDATGCEARPGDVQAQGDNPLDDSIPF